MKKNFGFQKSVLYLFCNQKANTMILAFVLLVSFGFTLFFHFENRAYFAKPYYKPIN